MESRWGRKKGYSKSKLDDHKEDIKRLLGEGIKQNKLAQKYGVTPEHMSLYIKNNMLKKKN